MTPVAVRRGNGPIHLAIKRGTTFETAHGSVLAGVGVRQVPTRDWQHRRRCTQCDEIAAHAPTFKMLRYIAGW